MGTVIRPHLIIGKEHYLHTTVSKANSRSLVLGPTYQAPPKFTEEDASAAVWH